MKQNDLPLALARIRLDGGTQVRERLNDAWVRELMELYKDGVEIAPVLVFHEKSTDSLWLVDGFHRLEAKRRNNAGDIHAHVLDGSLEVAKLEAARLSALGSLPRTAGDKKSAVLLVLSTVVGKTMGVRELARHCGVPVGYTSDIISGKADGKVFGTEHPENRVLPPPTKLPPNASPREVLWARIERVIRADVDRPSEDIAKEVGCHADRVRKLRTALGLPPLKRGPRPEKKSKLKRRVMGEHHHKIDAALRAKIDAALRADPTRSDVDIARSSSPDGMAGSTARREVRRRREALGLPPSTHTGSAPPGRPRRRRSDAHLSAPPAHWVTNVIPIDRAAAKAYQQACALLPQLTPAELRDLSTAVAAELANRDDDPKRSNGDAP